MVKGSLGSRMGPIVKALERSYPRAEARAVASSKADPMLYWLIDLSDKLTNTQRLPLHHISNRAEAMITALVFVFLFGPWIIDHLRVRQGKASRSALTGRPRTSSPRRARPHGRADDPVGIVSATVLWANPANRYVWIVLGVDALLRRGGLLRRLPQGHTAEPQGFSGRTRLIVEVLIAAVACVAIASMDGRRSRPRSRFRSSGDDPRPRLVLRRVRHLHHCRRRQCGEPDRRARRACHRAGDHRRAELRLHRYLAGNTVFAEYLNIHYVAGTGELAVLCGAVIGAGLGFLWFNAPPASIFMGDTGSLALVP